MKRYIYGQVHNDLWQQESLCCQTKEKYDDKQVNLFPDGSVCTYPSR